MQLSPVILTGVRVRLEPLQAEHLPALRQHGADAEVWRYIPACVRSAPEEAAGIWLERVLAAQARGEGLAFAVVDRERAEAVGGTTYMDVSASDRRLEIGNTWLGRAVWRTAVNTEAKLLLLQQAFETLGCHRVQLKTDARNRRSQAAIERLGAQREGVLRRHLVLADGFVRDTVMYSIIAEEWPGVKDRLRGLLNRPGGIG